MPLEDYQTLAKAGSGKYAAVYRVRRLADGQLFAMKKIQLTRMTPRERANALSEVRLLSAIRHPHVVALVEAFYDQFIETLCLVLELADGGDLNEEIQRRAARRESFSEEQIWSVVEQVSRGLEFLHSHGILHRDIKASNILTFPGGKVKISDLNVSKVDNGLSYTRTGTLTHASPQVWKGDRYDCKSDIWSFGCLLYEMICLRKPFQGENIEEICKRITKGQYEKITGEGYSRELRDLPTYMLQINPKLRPSANTLCKLSRNKARMIVESTPTQISFNLATVSVPGLDPLPPEQTSPYLQNSLSAEYGFLKRSMSKQKGYAPMFPSLKPVKEVELRQARSRYNCRNLSRLPSFHLQNTGTLQQKEAPQAPQKGSSNNVFKRLAKMHRFKMTRRNTEQ